MFQTARYCHIHGRRTVSLAVSAGTGPSNSLRILISEKPGREGSREKSAPAQNGDSPQVTVSHDFITPGW